MTRLLPLILAAAVYALGNALADGDWLIAFPLGVIVGVGVVKLGIEAVPPASDAMRQAPHTTVLEASGRKDLAA